MARLEIPPLFRLDIGSNNWGWHRMDQLVEAVKNISKRAPHQILLSPDAPAHAWAKALLDTYGILNQELKFVWSDEKDINFVQVSEVPYDNPNLFVSAQWGLRVISAVQAKVKVPMPTDREYFEGAKHCLSEREVAVMELRLGIKGGERLSLKRIAEQFQVTTERIRQIEAKALRKMARATVISSPVSLK